MNLSMGDILRFQEGEQRIVRLEGRVAALIAAVEMLDPSFRALELRVAELEKKMAHPLDPLLTDAEYEAANGRKRRGRPPKNLEERMKAQEHDEI